MMIPCAHRRRRRHADNAEKPTAAARHCQRPAPARSAQSAGMSAISTARPHRKEKNAFTFAMPAFDAGEKYEKLLLLLLTRRHRRAQHKALYVDGFRATSAVTMKMARHAYAKACYSDANDKDEYRYFRAGRSPFSLAARKMITLATARSS